MENKSQSLLNFYNYGFKKFDIENIESIEKYYNDHKYMDDGLSDNSKFIMSSRYLMDRLDENNNIIKESSWYEICKRVSRMLASTEWFYTYLNNDPINNINRIRLIELNIFDDLFNRRFIFNSPALFNLGIDLSVNPKFSHLIYNNIIDYDDYKNLAHCSSEYQMCFACFVIPVEDSLDGIYDSVKNAALISMRGGGVGTNFGRTREKGSLIRNGQGGISSGPLSWMKQWETMAEEVVQGGRRRAALMGLMDINHPDIEEFISCKDNDNVLSFFNISVSLTDKFMNAVTSENIDEQFELISRVNPQNNKFVNAKELWYKICEHAWKRGDPGIHFVDLSNQDSLLKMNNNWAIEATNPCGEMNLPFYVGKNNQNKYTITNIGCSQKQYSEDNIIQYNRDHGKDFIFSESGSACNLGSINLTTFVDNDTKSFNYKEFKNQIKRSCYYLDLMIDASKYPLFGIKRNSMMIRPIGLGIMGLHDTGIMLNMPYKADGVFGAFCNDIGKYLGIESLMASIEIVTKLGKDKFPESECVSDLFNEWINYINKINDNNSKNNDEKKYNHLLNMQKNNIKFLPPSIRNTLIECYSYNREYFKYIIENLCKANIRNSRRLSIAPTGTLSLIADVSSGIEPNFAFMWNRRVSVKGENGETEYKTVPYIHKLLPKEYKKELEENGTINNELFKTALEISPNDHLEVMGILAKYIDCSLSKTINLPNDATIEDIHNIYTRAHELGIKGITIYRDGSRSYQPLQSTTKKDNKEEKHECTCNHECINNITDEQISNILENYDEDKLINLIKNNDIILNKILSSIFNSKIPLEISNDKEVRNPINGAGSFIQIKSPYGTIHVAAKFNSRDQMREIFITLNKSGQELKAITEALSRLISIALQECINYKDTYNRLIKTLKGISGFEAFIYDNIRTGEEHLVKSIPDVIAYVLPDLEYLYLINKYGNNKRTLKRMNAEVKLFNDTIINNNDDDEIVDNIDNNDTSKNYLEKHNKFKELICPECGGTSFYKSDGCDKCLTCGYSKCGV